VARDKLRFIVDAYDLGRSGTLEEEEVLSITTQIKVVSESVGKDPKYTDDFFGVG